MQNMLSKYAPKDVITMTEEHLHDDSEKYIKKVKNHLKFRLSNNNRKRFDRKLFEMVK